MKIDLKKIIIFIAIVISIKNANAQVRTKENFGSDWEFKTDETNSNWEKIAIPHTSRIEKLVVVKQFEGISNYKKAFKVGDITNKKTFIYFEGVMIEADVFINNKKVANHKGGYLPFTVDASDYLIPNAINYIALTVSNKENLEVPPGKPLKDLDFYYYGGIYRNVQLLQTNKLYITNAVNANKIASGGLYAAFNSITKENATGVVQVHFKNEYNRDFSGFLKIILKDNKGKKYEFNTSKIEIKSNSSQEIAQKISIDNPKLWSIATPNLYNLEIQIIVNKKIVDAYNEKIGIRKSEIKQDGYYLNNEKIFITGTNRHQEYPYLGYAISDEAQYRDAVKIKNAGFDFVRLSHYPQAEAFLSACDSLGILVMNSLAGWQYFGNENFQNNCFDNIRDMARRDRNHPSIVFWENSLNETEMTEKFMQKATEVLKEELPLSRNYSASWIDNQNYDLFIPARQHAKAPDYWTKYANGSRKIFIAEYGDWEYYAQNAGFNQKDFSNLKEEERTSRQLRSFGEKRLLQQANNFQEASNSNRKGNNTIGEANWLMFDYNRGYSPDLESSGICDIFRIPKFAYSFYQSQRSPNIILDKKLKSGAMVQIANNWTADYPLDITIYSNCDEVALYLNNVLIGTQKAVINENNSVLNYPPIVFKLDKFSAGTLKAIGFINQKEVASNQVKTPEIASKIKLEYDLSSVPINPNSLDMVFVYAKIVDNNNTVIPNATNLITFEIESGNAEIVGQNPIIAEAGIATILLKTKSLKVPVTLIAKSENLIQSAISISK